jgi:hypothetical protein
LRAFGISCSQSDVPKPATFSNNTGLPKDTENLRKGFLSSLLVSGKMSKLHQLQGPLRLKAHAV